MTACSNPTTWAQHCANDPSRPELGPVRTWQEGPFHLQLFDTFETDHLGKPRLAYRFFDSRMGDAPVFEGSDFCASLLHAIDSDATVAALLGFLSLRPGDTEAEYFDGYSERQRIWRDTYAEELGLYVYELESGREG